MDGRPLSSVRPASTHGARSGAVTTYALDDLPGDDRVLDWLAARNRDALCDWRRRWRSFHDEGITAPIRLTPA